MTDSAKPGQGERPPRKPRQNQVDHLEWPFALVLVPAPAEAIPPYDKRTGLGHRSRDMLFSDFVVYTVAKLVRNGLEVSLVDRTETSQHKVCLLVRCPEEKFQQEYRDLAIRRWKRSGSGAARPSAPPRLSASCNVEPHNHVSSPRNVAFARCAKDSARLIARQA